jgi:hypothetical protein
MDAPQSKLDSPLAIKGLEVYIDDIVAENEYSNNLEGRNLQKIVVPTGDGVSNFRALNCINKSN